jgi:hypothetical protein
LCYQWFEVSPILKRYILQKSANIRNLAAVKKTLKNTRLRNHLFLFKVSYLNGIYKVIYMDKLVKKNNFYIIDLMFENFRKSEKK